MIIHNSYEIIVVKYFSVVLFPKSSGSGFKELKYSYDTGILLSLRLSQNESVLLHFLHFDTDFVSFFLIVKKS